MRVEVNKEIAFDPLEIRERRFSEGFVTSQKYYGFVDDIGDHRSFNIDLLRQIGSAQKMVAIICQIDRFDQQSGGGQICENREEEWADEDLESAIKDLQLFPSREILYSDYNCGVRTDSIIYSREKFLSVEVFKTK